MARGRSRGAGTPRVGPGSPPPRGSRKRRSTWAPTRTSTSPGKRRRSSGPWTHPASVQGWAPGAPPAAGRSGQTYAAVDSVSLHEVLLRCLQEEPQEDHGSAERGAGGRSQGSPHPGDGRAAAPCSCSGPPRPARAACGRTFQPRCRHRRGSGQRARGSGSGKPADPPRSAELELGGLPGAAPVASPPLGLILWAPPLRGPSRASVAAALVCKPRQTACSQGGLATCANPTLQL